MDEKSLLFDFHCEDLGCDLLDHATLNGSELITAKGSHELRMTSKVYRRIKIESPFQGSPWISLDSSRYKSTRKAATSISFKLPCRIKNLLRTNMYSKPLEHILQQSSRFAWLWRLYFLKYSCKSEKEKWWGSGLMLTTSAVVNSPL